MNDKLAKIERQDVAPVRNQVDIEALLKAAMERGPDIVERMMAVRRELNAEQAKAAYDQAMSDFQDECPPITKGRKVLDNTGGRLYNYAPFETILETVKPCLRKHGFTFTLDTDVESKDGWVIAVCSVTHVGGHCQTSKAKFPLGAGTRAMSTTQIYAAALSFASRRVFCNAFGIVTIGEDQDGAGDRPAQHGPSSKPDDADSLRNKLWAIMAGVRGKDWGTARAWLSSHNIIEADKLVKNLTVDELKVVIEKVEITLKPE